MFARVQGCFTQAVVGTSGTQAQLLHYWQSGRKCFFGSHGTTSNSSNTTKMSTAAWGVKVSHSSPIPTTSSSYFPLPQPSPTSFPGHNGKVEKSQLLNPGVRCTLPALSFSLNGPDWTWTLGHAVLVLLGAIKSFAGVVTFLYCGSNWSHTVSWAQIPLQVFPFLPLFRIKGLWGLKSGK